MTTTPLLEPSRLLWELVMSRPETREAHAAYVGTTEFLTIGDPIKKIEAQVSAIQAGHSLTDQEHALMKQIHETLTA